MTDPINALNQQLMQQYLARITSQMQEEAYIERTFLDDWTHSSLTTALGFAKALKPDTLSAALRGPNPFRKGVNNALNPIRANTPQWSDADTWTGQPKALLDKLVKQLFWYAVEDLTLYGKALIIPWVDQTGKAAVTLVRGFVFPIWSQTDPMEAERILAFSPYQGQSGQQEYIVWEFEVGLIRIYSGVKDPTQYRSAKPQEYPQPHASDRLPCSFQYYYRSRSGDIQSPAKWGLRAFEQYAQRLVQESVMYLSSAGPIRVITGQSENNEFGPFKTLQLSEGSTFQQVSADVANLKQHTEARTIAAADVQEDMGAPTIEQLSGESGDARIASMQTLEQTTKSVSETAVRLIQDAAELMVALGFIPTLPEFTHTPRFSTKDAAKQTALTALFGQQAISRYELLLQLQEVGVAVSQDEIDRAKKELTENMLADAEQRARDLLTQQQGGQ